jgi:uncharacterized protein (DUF1684 family)
MVMASTSGSSSPRKSFLEVPNPEDEGNTIFQNIVNYLPNNTASHPGRLESSATLL